jgi:hypothetical protein
VSAVVALAVAIGVTYMTGGFGSAAAGSILEMSSAALIKIGCHAALADLAARATVSMMQNQNPFQTAKEMASADSLKETIVTAGTAILTAGFGNGTDFIDKLQSQAARNFTRAGLSVVIQGEELGQAMRSALKSTVIGACGAYAAGKIGTAYDDKTINAFEHKLLHGGLGGAMGYILSGGKTEGFISGAGGAIIAETFAELVTEDAQTIKKQVLAEAQAEGKVLSQQELQAAYMEKVQLKADWGKMAGAIAALAAGQNVPIAIATATNAVEHNYLTSVRCKAAKRVVRYKLLKRL